MTEPGHTPKGPTWDCLACGQSWPCDPARESLGGELGGGFELAAYMVAQLSVAAADMPTAALAELYERFIAWTGSGGRPN